MKNYFLIALCSLAIVGTACAGTSTGTVTGATTPTNGISVASVPPTPSGCTIFGITSNNFFVAWNPGTNSTLNTVATTMFLQLGITNQANLVTVTNVPINITTIQFSGPPYTGLPTNTTFFCRVIAWDGVGPKP